MIVLPLTSMFDIHISLLYNERTYDAVGVHVHPSQLFMDTYESTARLMDDMGPVSLLRLRIQIMDRPFVLDEGLHKTRVYIPEFYNTISERRIDTEREYGIDKDVFKNLGRTALCFVVRYAVANRQISLDERVGLIANGIYINNIGLARYYRDRFGFQAPFDLDTVQRWTEAVPMVADVRTLVSMCGE